MGRLVWRGFVVAVAATSLATAFAPERLGRSTLAPAAGLLALVAVAAGVRRYRLDRSLLWHVGRPITWILLGCGLAILVGSGLLRALAWPHSAASPADVLALAAYPCLLAGLLLMVQGRAPGQTLNTALLSGIVAMAAGFALWMLVFGGNPVVPGPHLPLPLQTGLAGFAFPALDLLVLAVLGRLVMLSDEHPPAYSYLIAALASLLAVHIVVALRVANGWPAPYTNLTPPLLLAYGLWAAAALHPSMGTLFDPPARRINHLGTSHLVLFTTAQLLGPALLAIQAVRLKGNVDLVSAIVGTAVMSAMVVLLLVRMVRERAQLELQARHDDLTGLPRRDLFIDQVSIAVAAAHQRQGALAVMFIDLDRFKKINDSLGHAVGNQLLQLVARRLAQSVREDDTVARMGGDEFTILLREIHNQDDAVRVASKVLRSFRTAFTLGRQKVYVTASVGVALYPQDGTTPETLLKNADAAMYGAKDRGRNTYQLYTPGLNAQAHEWLELESGLHHAIERGELVLHYQPKVALRSGRVVGVEALVRWNHPELGFLGPDKFIGLAEESGLIAPLGEWALETACAQAQEWKDAGYPPITVAVNLSARQFQLQSLPDLVASVLRRTTLEARYLELELTESLALQGGESTLQTLEELVEMGVSCTVDDFGVGFSNFDYLDSLPISKIKIDKAFVRKIGTTANKPALVVGIIALGHGLGLQVVAEGVETPEQLEFLREHDCDQIQGYVFSKPLPAEELSSLLMLELVSPGPGRLGAPARPVRAGSGAKTRRRARSA
jgi:diguanylate cyclase (GGDEF)-like protein